MELALEILAASWQYLLFIPLLLVGYGSGRLAERRHYRSILKRESQFGDLIIMPSKMAPESASANRSELVMGSVVISVDYFKRYIANLRMLFGGRVHTYESLLDRGRREAILRMQEQARGHGARLICNVRLETASISKDARQRVGSVEVLAYGTALIP